MSDQIGTLMRKPFRNQQILAGRIELMGVPYERIGLFPIEKRSENAPDYTIKARIGNREYQAGSAWINQAAKTSIMYLSLRLRDPVYVRDPIYLAAFSADDQSDGEAWGDDGEVLNIVWRAPSDAGVTAPGVAVEADSVPY